MEEVTLKLTVDSVNSAKSVKEIKELIRDATNEALRFDQGTKSFAEFSNVAALAKDKLSDVREQMAALDPDRKAVSFMKMGNAVVGGFTAATGAMTLFGASTEDAQKAMLKVQAAMALLQGFQAIQDGAQAFKVLRGAVMTAVAGMNALKIALIATGVGAIAVLVGALAANWDKVKKSIDDLLPGLGGIDNFFDNLKKVAMGTLGSIVEGFKIFGELVKDLFTGDFKELAKDAKAFGSRIRAAYTEGYIEEGQRQDKAEADALLAANADKLKAQQEAAEKARKAREEAFTQAMKDGIEHQRMIDEAIAMVTEEDQTERLVKLAQQQQEFDDLNLIAIVKAAEAENEAQRQADLKGLKQRDAINAQIRLREQQLRDFKVSIASQSINMLVGLADLFAGKTLSAQKRAFAIQKAAGIAAATIDTFVAAQKAYASQIIPLDPTSLPRAIGAAAFSVAAGLLRVAKIAATKFDAGTPSADTGAGGSGFPGMGDIGGGAPSGVNFLDQPSTQLPGGGNTPPPPAPIVIENFISESEITRVQASVSHIHSQATIN